MNLLRVIGIGLFVLLAASLPSSEGATARGVQTQPIVIPLHPYADTPLQTVKASIGGQAIPFLFDTGGGLTFVTPGVADTLGCQPFGQATGFRADGEKIAFPRCGPIRFGMSGYGAQGEVGVFDLMAMIRQQVEAARKQGHEVAMPPTLGGLIGLSSFRHQVLTLDYAHDRIVVETPQSMRARVATMTPLDVRVATLPSGAIEVFVRATAAKGTLWLQLDSGNNGPTFLAPHAIEQLGLDLPKGEKKDVALDLTHFGSVAATVARRDMIYDGQLGIGLIGKMVITIDLQHDRAWAAMNAGTAH
ncbi:hypothetical protein J7I44_09430 [Frateuria sp. MAH-13]|uniref:Aspartyl protease n=1 Tax=Frateuria flava TaxID=2821489 RepID=A0ABS4DN89_9GAMM|nr:hypothetical protein [Frateuria flava]MBP1474524.1 hypothetical protein [Frateuria flava]